MKPIVLLVLCLFLGQVQAQKQPSLNGEFLDSTISTALYPFRNTLPEFYNFNAKYPQNSASTLKSVKSFLSEKQVSVAGSGYITFKFIIANDGKMSYVRVLQIDEKYKPKFFDRNTVLALYEFLKTLDKWKTDVRGTKINYSAFMSFKIQNGEVINVIP